MAESLSTLLRRWRAGDQAAGEQVMALAYPELRRLAAHFFRHEPPGHTLQPTALVHELFLKLAAGAPVEWQDRAHFLAVAAQQMRRILIDHARRRRAHKRNEPVDTIVLGRDAADGPRGEDLLAVDEALQQLESLEPRAARVVVLRVFGGLKEAEIAGALAISPATVKRDWSFARAWLLARLRSGRS